MKKSLLNKSDEELVRKYHSAPLNSVICYFIVTAILVGALILLGTMDSANSENLVWVLIGVCIIAPVLGELICPLGLQKEILKILNSRKIDVWKKGKELGVNISYKKARILITIATILWVVNFIFKIFGGLLICAFSLVIAVVLGGLLLLASLIFQVARANGLASACLRGSKLATIPLKLAGKLLTSLISFSALSNSKESLSTYKTNEKSYSSDALETDPRKMSKELSNLQINPYLSLDSVVSPSAQCKIAKKNIEASGTLVYFTIEAIMESSSNDTSADVLYCEREIKSQAMNILKEQISKFLKDYPNASDVKIDGEIIIKQTVVLDKDNNVFWHN